MTPEYTPEQMALWDAWQRRNAAASHKSDRMMRALGIAAGVFSVAALAAAFGGVV